MPSLWAGSQLVSIVNSERWREWYVRRNTAAPGAPNPAAPNVQYVGSTKWTAVAAWAATTAYVQGNLVRQLAAPTVGFERVFLCSTAGTSGGSEPLWSTPATAPTYGSVWVDGTVTWVEVTGRSAYGWSAPHARLAAALTVPWCAPGDWVYVSNNHAETQAVAMTIVPPGTAAKPTVILCVNDAGSMPPVAADLATTATVSTTSFQPINFGGNAYAYGITFSAGTTATNANIVWNQTAFYWRLEACNLTIGATASGGHIQIGTGTGSAGYFTLELINTTIKFNNAGHTILLANTRLRWENTVSAVTGTAPTALFTNNIAGAGSVNVCTVVGVDLSFVGSGNALVNVAGSTDADFYFQDCKLGSSVAITSGTVTAQSSVNVSLVNCDSASTNYRYYKQTYQGTVQQDTAVTRTGGASDGTTQVSRKMVSSANSQFFSPLESDPILYWNETLAPVTLTIPIVTETAGGQAPSTGLTNRDVWIEVEYLGTSGFPLGVYDTDTRAASFLALPVTQSLDGTSAWAGVLSAPVQQTLSSTFTPTVKGPVKVKVMLARPNTTIWFDPLVQVA